MVSVKGSSALGIIIAVIVLAVLIWNVVYISDVRKQLASGTSLTLSKTAADIIFWIDIILIVVIGIYLIYNIVIIFTTKEEIATFKQTTTEALTKSRAGTGIPIVRTNPIPTVSKPTTVIKE